MPGILALKLLLVPSLIVAITLAGRRWGASIAGCLAGFPVVTGPILFFLGIEQGALFAQHAAIAATIAVLSNIAFGIAYSWISRRHSWLISLFGGTAVFMCMVAGLNLLTLSAWQAALLTIAGLLLASRLYPKDEIDAATAGVPKSDLVYRVVAGMALVLGVTFFSSTLGANLSGLFSVFPVMGGVLAVFSHRNIGSGFAVRLLRGMVQGFFAFTAFCFILASTLASWSLAASFLTALAAALLVQGILMRLQAVRAAKQAKLAGAAP